MGDGRKYVLVTWGVAQGPDPALPLRGLTLDQLLSWSLSFPIWEKGIISPTLPTSLGFVRLRGDHYHIGSVRRGLI